MTERYIHAREIEEYLYCAKRWKQNKKDYVRSDEKFVDAIRIREQVREACAPTLPPEPPYHLVPFPSEPTALPKFVARIMVFFSSLLIFGVLGLWFVPLILTFFGPHIVSYLQRLHYEKKLNKAREQVRKMERAHEEEVQRVLWEAEQTKQRLLDEFERHKTIFLTEEYEEVLEGAKRDIQQVINQEFKFYDDDMKVKLDEEHKICWVLFDRSNEKIPHYVPIAHKYHIVRLTAQMLIAQNYFVGYKVRGLISYKNRKPYTYFLDKKSTFALNQVLRNIHQNSVWYIPNTYRCFHCPLINQCKDAREEARDYNERIATK